MFTLATGRLVHDKSTVTELLLSATKEPAPPLASAAPTLPAELCAVVDRALSFAPEDRFASAREMREAVQSARVAITPDDEAETVPDRVELPRPDARTQPDPPLPAPRIFIIEPPASPSPRRRPAVVVGLLGALALGGLWMGARWLSAARSTDAPTATASPTSEPKATAASVASTTTAPATPQDVPATALSVNGTPARAVATKPPRTERFERATAVPPPAAPPSPGATPPPTASNWLSKRR
jgi:serine/threonine-protein kinase